MGPFMVGVPTKKKLEDFLRIGFYKKHLHETNFSEKN
jgi:hypothetical protein